MKQDKLKYLLDFNLYFVTSECYSSGKSSLKIAKEAIEAGVKIIQMREKDKSYEEQISLGKELSLLCRKNDVLFIVNDNPNIAKAVNADGVHLGQEDIRKFSIDHTRDIIGEDKIIGLSTHSIQEVKEANKHNPDYIAFGPIFPTKTKSYSIGIQNIKKAIELSTKQIVFIGGVNLNNIDTILKLGARNIAVIRAIVESDNINATIDTFNKKINIYKKELITK